MIEQNLARCPIDGWIWKRKVSNPKQCPKCKYSYIYPGHKKAELFSLSFNTPKEATDWVDKANGISAQCKDLDELLRRMKKK
jgi:hypothetical protein